GGSHGHVARTVAVAGRSDRPTDHARLTRAIPVVAQDLEQRNRLPVHALQSRGVIAEPGAPVPVGTPGGAVEDEAGAADAGDAHVRLIVTSQSFATFRRLHEHE